MIRHLLMFRWKQDSGAEDRAAALAALGGMRDSVPSVRALSLKEALHPGQNSFDVLLEVGFDDQDGYASYLSADSHMAAWTNFLQPVCADLASIQVE